MAKIEVKGTSITVYSDGDKDFISLTDMLRAKDGDFFISDWLRNRNTVEFLGIWEQVHNPDFNYGGFATIKSQAGLNNYKQNPGSQGNIRDEANAAQLVCLANLEALNAHLIHQGLAQAERLALLNQTAIQQMTLLLADAGVQQLQGKQP